MSNIIHSHSVLLALDLSFAVNYNSIQSLLNWMHCCMSECLIFLLLSKGFPAWKHTGLAYQNILLGICHFWGRQCLWNGCKSLLSLRWLCMDWEDTLTHFGWGWCNDRLSVRSRTPKCGLSDCRWFLSIAFRSKRQFNKVAKSFWFKSMCGDTHL